MFIVYETTCLVNNKKYIGVHEQDKDDEYLGSGVALVRAIKKHGKDKFIRNTLHSFSQEQDAYDKEAELVTEDVVTSPDYYNMREGGHGGAINFTPEIRQKLRDNWNREARGSMSHNKGGYKLPDEFGAKQSKNKSHIYRVEKDNSHMGDFTFSEFCAIHRCNRISLKTCVRLRGGWKGYSFTKLLK